KDETAKAPPAWGDHVRTDPPQTEHRWDYVTRLHDGKTGREITLVRVTYQLPHAKAEALANLLTQHSKVEVLEVKVVGDSLILTTTPAAQKAISQFVSLIQGARAPGKSDTKTSSAPEEETRQFFRLDVEDVKKPAVIERKEP